MVQADVSVGEISCQQKCFHSFFNLTLSQVSHDRSFERNLSNCEPKPEKVRTSTGFEPVTSRYRCDALTN